MAVAWSVSGDQVVIAFAGEIDASNADALVLAVGAVPHDHRPVRVDMSAVGFMDSSLLRALLRCQAHFAMAGVDFKVRDLTEQARRVFELAHLDSLIE